MSKQLLLLTISYFFINTPLISRPIQVIRATPIDGSYGGGFISSPTTILDLSNTRMISTTIFGVIKTDLVYLGLDSQVGKASTLHSHTKLNERVTIGSRASIGHHTEISDNVNIGNHVDILEYSAIKGNSRISSHSRIGRRVSIAESVFIDEQVSIGDYTSIGKHNLIMRFVFIAAHSTLENNVTIREGSRIHSNCFIQSHATIDGNCEIKNSAKISSYVAIGSKCTISPNIHVQTDTIIPEDQTLLFRSSSSTSQDWTTIEDKTKYRIIKLREKINHLPLDDEEKKEFRKRAQNRSLDSNSKSKECSDLLNKIQLFRNTVLAKDLDMYPIEPLDLADEFEIRDAESVESIDL